MKKRIFIHIDVNNAFVSWTAVDMLEHGCEVDIRNRFCVVGGDEKKRTGIVLAKSNPAKKMGIITGETLYSARKKCPKLEIYLPNFNIYKKYSDMMYEYLKKYSPLIERFSIDECFIDYTECANLFGEPVALAYKIKEDIKNMFGFTVNVGIGNSKLCAKMASDFEKPDRVHTLFEEEIESKMYPLFIGDLFGIGNKTTIKLNNIGIKTIEDLAKSDEYKLSKVFKNKAGFMINLAKGIDNSEIISDDYEQKGIGNEITLDKDINDIEELNNHLFYLAEKVGIRIRRQKKYAYVIVVVLKDNFFRRRSHQIKMINATNNTLEIFNVSKEILKEMWKEEVVRLIGIRLENLVNNYQYQNSLFVVHDTEKENEKMDYLLDDLKEKFGYKIVKKASLLSKDEKYIEKI